MYRNRCFVFCFQLRNHERKREVQFNVPIVHSSDRYFLILLIEFFITSHIHGKVIENMKLWESHGNELDMEKSRNCIYVN